MKRTQAFINLLRDFVLEARLRGRRSKCPLERDAAVSLEQCFSRMLKKSEGSDVDIELPEAAKTESE